jgi:SAM-dependent methyltransferase
MMLAPPYGLLAEAYDDVIGRDFFARIRRIFEHLVARHRIAFASAADLGCGTGLFARYLNALWRVPVFGVDLSPAMLRVAASNCRDTNVTLLRQDIRHLRLPQRVDLVTANFDTLNHLVNDGELPALFRRVYDHLRPGGHFIFDFITPSDPLGGATMTRHRPSRDGRRQVTQRIHWVPSRRMLFYEVLFRDLVRPASRLELHLERTYWPRDIATWLMDAGLVLRDVLDAATLRKATAYTRRIIVVAQKPAPGRHVAVPMMA